MSEQRCESPLMRRALALAERGRTTVSPNPLVGCVLAHGDEIVGEGWHSHAGGPHAEIVALDAAGDRAAGSTAYVTLEPCNHTGRTGPCTQALLAAGVAGVVVAATDPFPAAAGGAGVLRRAGIPVDIGVCADAAERQNEVFLHGVRSGRPFVVAKAAVSLDGRIAAADGTSQWLTGPPARQFAHRLRAEVDAIVVGSGTVLADDPRLDVRLAGYAGAQPLRVVLDRRGRIGSGFQVTDDGGPTLLHRGDLASLMGALWERDVRSVLVEGGAEVLTAFLYAGLVDKLSVHVAPVLLGPKGRPLLEGLWAETLAEAPRFTLDGVEQLGDDAVLTLYPKGM